MGRIALIFLLLATACPRLGKKSTTRPSEKEVPATSEMLLEQLRSRYGFPKGITLRLKYQLLYEGERSQTFQVRIIGRDSVLWLSASLMGIEGLRMLWRRDSIFILYRLTREAYVGPIDSLRSFFPPVQPSDFLALLLGYWPPMMDNGSWQWHLEERRLRQVSTPFITEAILSSDLQIQEWSITAGEGTFQLLYDYRTATPKLPYPTAILSLPDESRLILTPKEVELAPTEIPLSFTIPEGYTIRALSDFGL